MFNAENRNIDRPSMTAKFNNAQKYVPMRSWTCSDKTRNKMNRFGFGKDDKKSDCRIMF